jgi:hypothetical protein
MTWAGAGRPGLLTNRLSDTFGISHGNSVFDTHHLSELKTNPEMSSLHSAYSVAGI